MSCCSQSSAATLFGWGGWICNFLMYNFLAMLGTKTCSNRLIFRRFIQNIKWSEVFLGDTLHVSSQEKSADPIRYYVSSAKTRLAKSKSYNNATRSIHCRPAPEQTTKRLPSTANQRTVNPLRRQHRENRQQQKGISLILSIEFWLEKRINRNRQQRGGSFVRQFRHYNFLVSIFQYYTFVMWSNL